MYFKTNVGQEYSNDISQKMVLYIVLFAFFNDLFDLKDLIRKKIE
jgi:hypothetical protein